MTVMKPQSAALSVGDKAPDFALPDAAAGQEYSLPHGTGQDLLLVFFRGTWCPFCQEQMRVLVENHARLTRSDVRVVGVVCQNAASVQRFVQANPLPFPLLVDERRTVAKAYGVHYWLSWEGINLATPALFIVDGAGRIVFRHVGRNMRDLPITAVLERFIGFLDSSGKGPATA